MIGREIETAAKKDMKGLGVVLKLTQWELKTPYKD